MAEQKRFQKKNLNSDDNMGMENGAKALKGFSGAVVAAVTIFANKDNLKTLGKEAAKIAAKVIKR